MFLHWTEVYHVERLVPLLWIKSSWKRLSLPGKLLSNFIVIKEPASTGQVPQQVCAVWLVLQHVHCVYHPPSSGLVDHGNCMTKIQAGKICQGPPNTLPKAMPLVHLNLRSTPLGTHKLSLLETGAECPMNWLSAFFRPTIEKERYFSIEKAY